MHGIFINFRIMIYPYAVLLDILLGFDVYFRDRLINNKSEVVKKEFTSIVMMLIVLRKSFNKVNL